MATKNEDATVLVTCNLGALVLTVLVTAALTIGGLGVSGTLNIGGNGSTASTEHCTWKFDPNYVMPAWLDAEMKADVIKPTDLCRNTCPPSLHATWIAPGDICTLHQAGKMAAHPGDFEFCNRTEFANFNDATSIGYDSRMHVKACLSDDSIDFLWHADPPRCVGPNGIPAIREDGLLYCAAKGSFSNPYAVKSGQTIGAVNQDAAKCDGGAFNSDASGISSPKSMAYCVHNCFLLFCDAAWFQCNSGQTYFSKQSNGNVQC